MIARWFWREWRSPSLIIVWLALSLAVACVLALGSISDRIGKRVKSAKPRVYGRRSDAAKFAGGTESLA